MTRGKLRYIMHRFGAILFSLLLIGPLAAPVRVQAAEATAPSRMASEPAPPYSGAPAAEINPEATAPPVPGKTGSAAEPERPSAEAGAAETAAPDPSTVVARVGDRDITEGELQEVVRGKIQSAYSHGQDLSRNPQYRREGLDEMIEVSLLSRAAAKNGIAVPDDVIDSVVESNIKQQGSEKALRDLLAFRGLTMDGFRSRIRDYRLANEFMKKLYSDSAYTEDELKQYYEKNRKSFTRPDSVHLYDIQLKVDPSAPEEAWQKKRAFAEELLQRVRSGESFSDIAYKNSDDAYRVKGGDLGYIHRGMLTPQELEDAAFSLKPGEVSGVIRTLDGFHIMKAGESRPGETLEFEKVKDELAKKLQLKRFEEKKAGILNEMRAAYPVVILIPLEPNP